MIPLVLAFAAIAFVDITPLALRKQWKTLVITSMILLIGFVLSIVFYYKRYLPSPLDIVTDYMHSIGLSFDVIKEKLLS